jgi:uncharacterized protein YmfQ (DUF2313 family)
MTPEPRRNAEAYSGKLQSLLPRGSAWTRNPDATLTHTLEASATELARVDGRAHDLIDEANPLSTWHGMEDWERNLALPDECSSPAGTMQERRDAVIAKLNDTGRQDLAYWYELAANMGYEITIEEFSPFVCGVSECGDADAFAAEHPNTGRLGDENIRYWWNVVVHGPRLILFRCGESGPTENLGEYIIAEDLECRMRKEILAHTYLTFEYREE